MFVSSNPNAGGEKQDTDKPLLLAITFCEGDPLGSREAGTLRLLAPPRVITRQNRQCEFLLGDGRRIPIGTDETDFVKTGASFRCTPALVKDGKVKLDLTLSNTTPGDGDQTAERIQVHTQSTRTITTVKLDEVIKLRFGKADGDKQRWVELSVEVSEQ